MNEYAILSKTNGRVINMCTTPRSIDQVRASWPDYSVRLSSDVPHDVLSAYRFWAERP